MILSFMSYPVLAQNSNQTLSEKLGYPADAKLLIIHADDAGISHSENIATIKALEEGGVNSVSIMVPCPWFPEIAEYARLHSEEKDFGLHLTVTSEWKNYKWGPTSSKNMVPSLVNENGYFFHLEDSIRLKADLGDVEREITAQIEKALSYGIDITHLDAHMGAIRTTPELMEVYIKKGREYNLPVLLSEDMSSLETVRKTMKLTAKDIVVDHYYQADPEIFAKGMESYYEEILNNLKPGLSTIIIHLAENNEEMKAVTIDHPNWGNVWRQEDLDFFTSDKAQELIEKNNIIMVTWRELRDKIVRAD
ncbi:polysaccharide deacetylase family protein [Christiangramia crocea]|uniref:Polysaccharide deacetylase family protein n=1 Tax=Christiangramia crocea TaxID=2904124 RepID=A0A9X1UXB3_9FLAO|nr:polysaccharide deacetylase family protein [Gramella crocea]MCG9971979.1 polysaccharide deacetylase family protein [Gramella crocea]